MLADWKCSVTTAIISVLVYLLIVYVLNNTQLKANVGKEVGTGGEWYSSLEYLMFLSVLIGYNLNNHVFTACKAN